MVQLGCVNFYVYAVLILFWVSHYELVAQSSAISGVINTYTSVTRIDSSGFAQVLDVKSSRNFAIDDKVLIIQMRGATIEMKDTTAIGNVLDYQGAGSYEFGTVTMVSGNAIQIDHPLEKEYHLDGKVQIVRIPEYFDCTVTDTLKAKHWDGETGGVLAFYVYGTLTLNAPVSASGMGFRGGNISNNPDGYCLNGSLAYFYPLKGDSVQWVEGGAMKGEGIAMLDDHFMAGKGPLANGGGGGNKHNAGGGGGSNYTTGGHGGHEIGLCKTSGNGGIGGVALDYEGDMVFMGGGGGCGDYNDNVGTNGTNGGGIILLKASNIVGNAQTIQANGLDQNHFSTTTGDGSGGGGAGGTILLEVQTFSDSLYITANGGNGGSQSENAFVSCFGPGGGGGTGMIKINGNPVPAYVQIETAPGEAGKILNEDLPCFGTNYGATNGEPNPVGYLLEISERIDFGNVTPTFEGEPVTLDKKWTLKISFAKSKAELLDTAKVQLDELVLFMNKYPSVKIELAGHTDNVGLPELNLKLSENRVVAVKDYLVTKGVDGGRIATVAYGSAQPIASNDYEWNRKKNRRVEMTILTF